MTIEDLAVLRHYIDEQDKAIYGDAFLFDIIGRTANLYAAAAEVWGMKAARFSKLVDVTESGSARRMSQRAEAARQQAAYYLALSVAGTSGTDAGTTATRPIVRSDRARS